MAVGYNFDRLICEGAQGVHRLDAWKSGPIEIDSLLPDTFVDSGISQEEKKNLLWGEKELRLDGRAMQLNRNGYTTSNFVKNRLTALGWIWDEVTQKYMLPADEDETIV